METADIVAIGGGVIGGAVAFYLAKQKTGRVIVLDRHAVAQGNSSLAAGLLTRARFISDLVADRVPFVASAPHWIDRFGEIDPLDPEFIQQCATATIPAQAKQYYRLPAHFQVVHWLFSLAGGETSR